MMAMGGCWKVLSNVQGSWEWARTRVCGVRRGGVGGQAEGFTLATPMLHSLRAAVIEF